MRYLSLLAATVSLTLAAQASFADISSTFATNPLTDAGNLIQGPDAANAGSRFTYNAADTTLTAHFDTTDPTVKLLFPLGQHVNQNTSFQVSAVLKITNLNSPPDFGGSVPAFGLVNSATTGDRRASTGHFDSGFNFIEDTPGNAYDMVTFDYYPTQDSTFGGNSINLTTVQTAGAGFNNSFRFGFANATLPMDQFLTIVMSYNATSKQASLNWGGGSLTSNLTGATFDVDSFAITLWNDANLAPASPAEASGSAVSGDIVFDSFAVQVPEPASLGLLSLGMLLLLRRRSH